MLETTNMKILMISPQYPYPIDNGSKRRIAAVLEFFAQRHQVTLVSLEEVRKLGDVEFKIENKIWKEWVYPIRASKALTVLRSLISRRSYRQIKFWNNQMFEKIQELLSCGSFDLIYVHFLSSVRFIEEWSDLVGDKPLLLLDQQNVFTTFWDSFVTDSGNQLIRIYSLLERRKSHRLQASWFPRFDLIAAVSQQDLEDSLPFLPESQVSMRLVPNGVDLEYFDGKKDFSHSTSPQVVFVGSMDALMNQEAVLWFANQIWGIIKREMSDSEFVIVGRNPPIRIRQLAQRDGIIVTGNIPEVKPYLARASLCVIPIHLGGGTKFKILEAMAMELPIVSTSAGANGVDVVDGEHLYLADDPLIFASRIVELLRNQELAQSMGVRARSLVKEKYSWNAVLLSLESELKLLMGINQRVINTE